MQRCMYFSTYLTKPLPLYWGFRLSKQSEICYVGKYMTTGNTFNNTSKQVTKANRDKIKVRSKLYRKWIDEGFDRKMPFTTFCKKYGKLVKRGWIGEYDFSSGKHQGKNIGSVIHNHQDYITYILENNPHGTLAKEIVNFCNRNPNWEKWLG